MDCLMFMTFTCMVCNYVVVCNHGCMVSYKGLHTLMNSWQPCMHVCMYHTLLIPWFGRSLRASLIIWNSCILDTSWTSPFPFFSQLSQETPPRLVQQDSTEGMSSPKYSKTTILLHDFVNRNLRISVGWHNVHMKTKHHAFGKKCLTSKDRKISSLLFLAHSHLYLSGKNQVFESWYHKARWL